MKRSFFLLFLTILLASNFLLVKGNIEKVLAEDEVTNFVFLPFIHKPHITSGIFQETSREVIFNGDWSFLEDEKANGGGYAISNTYGSTAKFTFSGNNLVLYRNLSPFGGNSVVYIDSIYAGNIVNTFPEERYQIPAIFDNLGSGIHTVTIETGYFYPDSIGNNIYIDAFTLPSNFQPSTEQLVALDHVNYYRDLVGIPLVEGNQAINLAAQSHAEFVAKNWDDPRMGGLGFHSEYPDLPGYTGSSPSQRAKYFGYTGGCGEVGHFLGNPIKSIDGWMATVYHRNLLIIYRVTEIGYGMVKTADRKIDVINMGDSNYKDISLIERKIFTYPANNQQNVPISWNGGENPDPLPETSDDVGYPISLHVVKPDNPCDQQYPDYDLWAISTAELKDSSGKIISSYILDRNTDPNKYLNDEVFIIPKKPLNKNTTYTAHIAGTDFCNITFDYSWIFTTTP